MRLSAITFSSVAAALALLSQSSPAGSIYKQDNNVGLDQAGSWTNGAAPGAGDAAIWAANVATASNCTNTLGGSVTWAGIRVLNPVAPVKVLTNNTPVISLGSSGINLSNASVSLWLAPALTTVADQTWSVTNGQTLQLGETSRNVTVANNVTVIGHVVFPNAIVVNNGGSLTVPNGSLLESTITNNAASSLSVGASGGTGTVNQTGGTVSVGRPDGTSGSPKAGLVVGGSAVGTYNISGGSLIDGSPANGGRIDLGTSSGVPGTLNVSGSALVQLQSLYVANGGSGVVNVTNGLLTVANNAIRVGTGTGGTGTVNVYGGTLSAPAGINVQHSTTAGAGAGNLNLYGGHVFVGGSLNVPNGIATGTVTLTGGALVVTNYVNLPNNAAGTGVLNLNGGVLVALSLLHPAAGSGTVVYNGGTLKAEGDTTTFIAPSITANVSTNGAVIDTTNFSITIGAALLNGTSGSADGGLTKLGSGTLTLTAANTYNGPTTVSNGTLAVNSASWVAAGAHLVVAPGATLDVSGADTISVATAPTLGGTLVMQISKSGSTLTSDKLVLASGTFNCGGALTVNATGNALAPGDSFDLFDAPLFSGGFTTVTLPSLTGNLSWDTSRLTVDGTIRIPGTNAPGSQPAFTSIRSLNGTSLVLGGSNGAPNTAYYVLSSTNVALPLASWTLVASNVFDTNGRFTFTNAVNPALSDQFFALSLAAPALSPTDSSILQALQNVRDEGFNSYLTAPGGLYINWIYTNHPPLSPAMVNINYDGTPDPSPTTRHDRLTDIVYLACLVRYKQAHPLDTQFDADIARYTTVCQSTSGDNYLNKPDQRGWIYWVLQEIISGLPSFTGYDNAQADKYYSIYLSNLAKFNNQVTPLYIDWNTNDDAGLHGYYNVSLVTEDACVLIVNGKARNLPNYVAAGEALMAFAQSNAYSATLKLWPDTMGYLFTTTNQTGATVSPPAQQVIYDNSLPLSEMGETIEALCRAEAADPGKGYGALALATLNKLAPATNSFGAWDAVNGGYYSNLILNGTNVQSPSLTASVNTSYKTCGRAATLTQSFLAANHYAGASYSASTILAVHNANLNAYYAGGHGWVYQQNPDYSLYLDHGTGYSVLQNWVTTEATSHAVRALLTYQLKGPQ